MNPIELIKEFRFDAEEVAVFKGIQCDIDKLALCDLMEDKGKIFIPYQLRRMVQGLSPDTEFCRKYKYMTICNTWFDQTINSRSLVAGWTNEDYVRISLSITNHPHFSCETQEPSKKDDRMTYSTIYDTKYIV